MKALENYSSHTRKENLNSKNFKKKSKELLYKNLIPYIFIMPALIFLIVVIAYPIIQSFFLSLYNYKLTSPVQEFIGIKNYVQVIRDPVFIRSLLNTVIWVTFGVFFQFLLGLILALVLNKKFYGRSIVRVIVMIPWVTPGVLIALMWTWMYDGNYGIINEILKSLGFIKQYIPWLAQTGTSLPSAIITIIWQGIPFFALMILAGLQSIPGELYEAAKVDGANNTQIFFRITLPMLKNTILVTTLLRIIWVANSVDIIYTMTGGGPGYSSMTLSVYTFIKARASLDFGYASTLSIYLTIMLLGIIFLYLKQKMKGEK